LGNMVHLEERAQAHERIGGVMPFHL
jgi:hypothetical protein